MSNGFCSVLLRSPGIVGVTHYFAILELNSITLANPLTGKVTTLREPGVQVDIDPSDVVEAIADGKEFTLQLWFDGSHDLVTAVKWEGSLLRFTHMFDGLTVDQREASIGAVWGLMMQCMPLLVELVINPRGNLSSQMHK